MSHNHQSTKSMKNQCESGTVRASVALGKEAKGEAGWLFGGWLKSRGLKTP